LYQWRGAKFVTLVNRLGVSRPALRQTLDAAIQHGWVQHNTGHGHPLRPEYVLAAPPADAVDLGPPCERLMSHLGRLDVEAPALRKWSMPVLHAVGREPARFGAIRGRLGRITDRALTLALKDLIDAGLLERDVYDEYPPTTLYRVTRKARSLLEPLDELQSAA
jgi:DNA-binding HxlR family transcriptional regulator